MFYKDPYMLEQAKLSGGLLGRVSGSIGGIIFGGARTKTGKVVTAREWVMPSEITDTDVLEQRIIFACAVHAVRYLGATLWTEDFNRAIGQLPGFHSMMSIILKSTDRVTRDFSEPPDTPLGNLHAPEVVFTTHSVTAGMITATWDGGLGLNGTDADVLEFFGIEVVGSPLGVRGAVNWIDTAVRSDLSMDIATGGSGIDWIAAAYFQGAGTAEGLLSRCQWHAVTSMV